MEISVTVQEQDSKSEENSGRFIQTFPKKNAKLTLIQFMDSNSPLGEMVFIFRGCIETYNAHCFYTGNITVKVKKILEDLSKHFRKKMQS